MSLTGALNNAVSGLQVSQAALALVSNNVANANNEDYTRKIAQQQQVIAGDQRAGVKISEIRRVVDEFLAREVHAASGKAGRYEVQLPFLNRLQSFFGTPSDENVLTGRLDAIFGAFEFATTAPDSALARTEAVRAIQSFEREIAELMGQAQTLRADADRQIAQEISDINNALVRIEELNQQISREVNTGGDATEYRDLRDAQVNVLAAKLDISTYERSDGQLAIYAGAGAALVENGARILVYNPASTVLPGTIFGPIEVFQRDSTGNPTGTGRSLQTDIGNGRLRGLLDLRDVALPATSITLGELAQRVVDEINRAHNDNTAFPPPNTLTSSHNTGLSAADNHNFTGIARFSVIDPNAPTAGDYGVAATVAIDFGAIGATVNDVITAVNAGLGGAGTLALTNGVLTFTAANAAHGVGIVQDATTPSTRAGRGFSHFFGLNDVVTSTSPPFYDHGFTAAENHGFVGFTTFNVYDANGENVATVSFDAGTAGATFAGLATALDTALGAYATVALNAATGKLEITPATGYSVFAADQSTPTASNRNGTGIGLATLMGLGPDKVQTFAENMQVRSDIVANSTLLGFGRMQGTAVNDIAITPGDNRGALALVALRDATVSINAAGNIGAKSTTLVRYASEVISDSALYAAQTQGLADDIGALHISLDTQQKQLSGVNIDEELSTMIVLQNAFSASARVVSTIDQLYDDLLGMLR